MGNTPIPSILVVEDFAEHAHLIATSLGEGYRIMIAKNMSEAIALIDEQHFDLFLLDVMLPDGDGYQICSQLKLNEATKETPVIFLSSKQEVTDKVIGFSLGAEDYIVKPCNPMELKARVDSKLRRMGREELLSLGGLHLDFIAQKISADTPEGRRELDLTPREYKLIAYMARHRGVALSRTDILKNVWGENMHVSDRSVDTHIAALRKKLGEFGSYILSVHGTGYRFSVDNKPFKKVS